MAEQKQPAVGYSYDNRGGQDLDAAIAEQRALWEQGQPGAALAVGLLYRDKGDYAEALRWYDTATAAGDMKSARYAGLLYERGLGVAKDEEKAVACYRVAAQRGDTTARTFLGNAYLFGRGVRQDYARAYAYYLDAAQHPVGHTKMTFEACYRLGCMYEHGLFVRADRERAAHWYALCADFDFSTPEFEVSSRDAVEALERLAAR